MNSITGAWRSLTENLKVQLLNFNASKQIAPFNLDISRLG